MTPCVVCKEAAVQEFLDLGETTLANRFVTADELGEAEPTYPLRVGFCTSCSHVQLTEIVSPPEMFDHYLYISSMSETLKNHLHDLAATIVRRCALTSDDLVVDVGSNDGTLLSGFAQYGVRTLGVDPAANLAALAREKGVETHTGYFGAETARKLLEDVGRATVITSTNSFPHIPDLSDFMAGVDILLKDDGALVIEAHYLRDLLEQRAFDTVYHEHVSYWAVGAAQHLFTLFGMEVVNVERLPLHHGQIRMTVRRKGVATVEPVVAAMLADEKSIGLDRLETYHNFAQEASRLRDELNATLDRLKAEGRSVAGYGAPAKGNTLLTFLGIGPDRIDYIADRSPLKQGRYTPGTHIPVVGAENILADQPDYVLLLAWNFADEIMAQQAEYRERGGKFIVPVPDVRIV